MSRKTNQKAIILIVLGFIGYFSKLTLSIFLAHHVTHALYGDFMVALSSFSLVTSLILLGTGTAAKGFLSLYLRKRQVLDAQQYIHWNLTIFMRSAFFCLLFVGLIYLVMLLLHGFQIKSFDSYHLAFYMLVLTPLGALSLLACYYMQCNNNLYWSNLCLYTFRALIFTLSFTLIIYFLDASLSIAMLWWAWAFTYLCLLSLELMVLYFKAPHILSINKTVQTANSKNHKLWFSTSRRLVLSQIIYLILSSLGLYMIEILGPNEASVGHYAAIWSISSVLLVISQSVYQFVTPKISFYLTEKNYKKLQFKINSALAIAFLFVCPMFLIMSIWGNSILGIFGSGFQKPAVYGSLLLILGANFILSFSKPAVLLLANSGHEKWFISISAIELVVLLVLGCPLTYFFGILGTALATFASILVKSILMVIRAKKSLPCKPMGFI